MVASHTSSFIGSEDVDLISRVEQLASEGLKKLDDVYGALIETTRRKFFPSHYSPHNLVGGEVDVEALGYHSVPHAVRSPTLEHRPSPRHYGDEMQRIVYVRPNDDPLLHIRRAGL